MLVEKAASVKPIADVKLEEVDGAERRVGEEELPQDAVERMSKLHGLKQCKWERLLVDL